MKHLIKVIDINSVRLQEFLEESQQRTVQSKIRTMLKKLDLYVTLSRPWTYRKGCSLDGRKLHEGFCSQRGK